MKKLYYYLGLAAAAVGLSSVANANPELKITDGVTTIIVVDNGVGDGSSVGGRIVWNGSIGVWTLNTDVGTTFPVIGTLSNPQLDLSFNAFSTTGGTLTLTFSADGFGPTAGTAVASIGGTAQGNVSYQTFGGTNNTLLDTSHLLTSQGPFGGSFSGSVAGGTVTNVGPYALSQQLTITHSGSGITTGDALLTVPESGTSLLLLGAGLLGLALMAQFRPRLA
jgi:hypothetical protein